jgi:heptosyltransferase-3
LMVIVHNLSRYGIAIDVYGRPAHALREWFPRVHIRPLPAAQDSHAVLAAYDTVLQMQRHEPYADLVDTHPGAVHLREVLYAKNAGCMAQRFATFCRDRFGLPQTTIDNGIVPPRQLHHRRHPTRVLIHPEASRADKRWLPRRFIAVAKRLRAAGYDVHFVIAPHERERWRALGAEGFETTEFDKLHDLACWVYESGWCIANDSGIGHLASNLGVPTISLFRRRGISQSWRPAWGRGDVVLPWQWVPTAFLKERLWRQTLTCARVLAAFKRMVRNDLGGDAKWAVAGTHARPGLVACPTTPPAPDSIPEASSPATAICADTQVRATRART